MKCLVIYIYIFFGLFFFLFFSTVCCCCCFLFLYNPYKIYIYRFVELDYLVEDIYCYSEFLLRVFSCYHFQFF